MLLFYNTPDAMGRCRTDRHPGGVLVRIHNMTDATTDNEPQCFRMWVRKLSKRLYSAETNTDPKYTLSEVCLPYMEVLQMCCFQNV